MPACRTIMSGKHIIYDGWLFCPGTPQRILRFTKPQRNCLHNSNNGKRGKWDISQCLLTQCGSATPLTKKKMSRKHRNFKILSTLHQGTYINSDSSQNLWEVIWPVYSGTRVPFTMAASCKVRTIQSFPAPQVHSDLLLLVELSINEHPSYSKNACY